MAGTNTYAYVSGNPLAFIDRLGLASITFRDGYLQALWDYITSNSLTGAELQDLINQSEGPDILVTSNNNCDASTLDAGNPTISNPNRQPNTSIVSIDRQLMYELFGTNGDYWVGTPHILVHEVAHGLKVGSSEAFAIEFENNYQLDIAGSDATQRVLPSSGFFSFLFPDNEFKNKKCGCGAN